MTRDKNFSNLGCVYSFNKYDLSITVKYLPKKQIWIDTYGFHVYKALWEQRREELVMR